ncbi:helix-turn-helix domain-containing protein [Thermodesulfobacteriota bacterium]
MVDLGARIRAFRRNRNLSLTQLSKITGIAPSNLSSIELNKSSPTLSTLVKIADAFEMKVGAFLDEVVYPQSFLCRKGQGKALEGVSGQQAAELLSAGVPRNMMDCRTVTMAATSDRLSLEAQPGDRFLHCLSGSVNAHVNDDTYSLERGDSLYVLTDTEVALVNEGASQATVLIVSAWRMVGAGPERV